MLAHYWGETLLKVKINDSHVRALFDSIIRGRVEFCNPSIKLKNCLVFYNLRVLF